MEKSDVSMPFVFVFFFISKWKVAVETEIVEVGNKRVKERLTNFFSEVCFTFLCLKKYFFRFSTR